jgi:hypothetical protein
LNYQIAARNDHSARELGRILQPVWTFITVACIVDGIAVVAVIDPHNFIGKDRVRIDCIAAAGVRSQRDGLVGEGYLISVVGSRSADKIVMGVGRDQDPIY